jgi:hypothetical protein
MERDARCAMQRERRGAQMNKVLITIEAQADPSSFFQERDLLDCFPACQTRNK